MKTILLILLSFNVYSQSILINDKTKHYKSSINIVNFAASSSTYIQYELCKKVRLSVSLAIGLTAGIAATNAKEDIWDDKLKLGNKSNEDREVGIIGAFVGTLTYIPGHNKWFVKKKNLEY